MTALVLASAVGSALVAGIFYAFSTFIMRALGRLAPRQGIAAMQSINVVVVNPMFLVVFFGTGMLCAFAIVLVALFDAGAPLVTVAAGGALYLIGCLGVTIAGNVPLNDRLAEIGPDDDGAVAVWDAYLVRWTRWNHVRTAASLAAAACLVIAAAAT